MAYKSQKDQEALGKKFKAVLDDIKIEEGNIFDDWGKLSLENDFDRLLECLIEGLDYEACLKECYGLRMIDLFNYFDKNEEAHRRFVKARLFSVNKIINKLNDNLKMYRNEAVLYNINADKYIKLVKDIGKADLAMNKDAPKGDADFKNMF